MNVDLTDPIFHDEDKAREWLEASRWPNGPFCPHCGSVDVLRMEGMPERRKKNTHARAGAFHCRDCREQFTVRTGQVMERSHVPLAKWVLAYHLMAASKKGVSAHQLNPAPLGGEGKVIEADEAYHGRKEIREPSPQRRGRPYTRGGKSGPGEKRAIMALVERGGEARAFTMQRVTASNVREKLVTHVRRESRLNTDESRLYDTVGTEFAAHETVNHSAGEYAYGKGDKLVTTNTVEGFFGIFKRGMIGTFHHCGEQHLQRYLDEFSFRWNTRSKLGVEDAERAVIALHKGEGKRLTWRRIDRA
jgi:transposase-like protein